MVASVPWAEPGSRFTRDFEAECAWLMTVANQKTVSGFLHVSCVLLQCLFDRFGSVFPQCGLMVFPGVVIVSR